MDTHGRIIYIRWPKIAQNLKHLFNMRNLLFKARRHLGILMSLTALTAISCDLVGEVNYQDPKDLEVTTLISDLPANDALSVGIDGNVYASNFGRFEGSSGTGTTLLKITTNNNTFNVVADNLVGPLGNVVDVKGNVYVNNGNDFVDADILKIDRKGNQSILATVPGFPSGMTLDRSGNLYISNFTTPTIHKVTSEGVISILAEDDRLAGCVGIDMDSHGNLVAGNYLNGEIYLITMEGTVESIASIPTVIDGFVLGYLTVLDDVIYGTAIGEGVIYRISMEGEVTLFAGNANAATIDGPLLDASFNYPNGIASDPLRKILYISEFGGTGALRAINLRK